MTINVLGQNYRILRQKGLTEFRNIDGETDSDAGLILIDSELVGTQYRRVLLHEMIHAFMFRCGYDQVLSEDSQELLAEQLSTFLDECLSWELLTHSEQHQKS